MAGQGGFITITISGGDQLRVRARQLATWGMSVSSLEPAWTEVGEDLMADFARNMIQGGGFFGGSSKWAPLAPSTIREKQRLGFGAMPIMWRTGALAESLAEKGAAFINAAATAGKPFALEIAPYAPHGPFTPAPNASAATV